MPDARFSLAAFPPAVTGGVDGPWFPYANTPPWPPWYYYAPGGAGGVGGGAVSGYPRAGGSHRDMSRTAILTPVIIAAVALVGSAFLLVTYYRVFARYCSAWQLFGRFRRRRVGGGGSGGDGDGDYPGAGGGIEQGFLAIAANTGLDEAIVKKIPVYLYSEGVVSGSECAVCLGEFQDEDELRLLPKCAHAFHVACIDAWLRSRSNCPLCRAIVVAPAAALGREGRTRSQDEQQEQPQQQQQAELGTGGESHQGELVLTLGVDSSETQDGDGPSIGADTAAGVEFRRSSSMRAMDRSPGRRKELRRCHSLGSKSVKYESGELLVKERDQQQPGLGFVVLNIEVGSSSSASSSSGSGDGEEADGDSDSGGGGGGGGRRSPLRKSSLLRAPASLMHGVFSLGLRKSTNGGSHSEGGGA